MSSTNAGTSGAQHWRKLGVLRDPAGAPLVAAMLPTPHRLSESRLRLFYGALDADTVSRVHSVDIDLGEPTLARAGSHDALLDIGEPGHFDDNGVVPSAAVEVDAELRLYYVGFQKQTKVPYTMFTGLAVSSDGGASFRRARTVPLLERSTAEPFFRTAPWATVEDDVWRMWYIGGGTWLREGEKVLPSYALRTMISADGISWPAVGTDCIVPSGDEIGFGRPCCIAGGGLYRLWYSVRSRRGYRPGYAESSDGEHWRRLDSLCDLGAAIPGFDDEMIAYVTVVPHGERLVMFYNGNGFGRTGIGVAILEPSSLGARA